MAAIICRVLFVEPCKALGRCINGCCKCCGDICDEIGKCCEAVCNMFERPFSFCLFFSVALNIASLIYALLSLTGGTVAEDCDTDESAINIYLILLIVFTILNSLFSGYMFYAMNTDEMRGYLDPVYAESHPPQSSGPANSGTIGSKAWQFFQYNYYFAGYIVCVLIPSLVIIAISMNARCGGSSKTDGLYWSAVLIIIYLSIGALVLSSYIFIDAMKSASQQCYWWCVPCFWPCLLIGVCVNMLEDGQSQHPPATAADRQAQANRPVRGPKDQGRKQPMQAAPSNSVAQTYPSAPVGQPLVAVAIIPSQPQYNNVPQYNTMNNQQNPGIQPHYTNGGPSAPSQQSYAPQQQQQQQQQQQPANAQTGYNANANVNANGQGQPGQQKGAGDVAYDVAKAGGVLAAKGGKKAIGWAAKGLNKLNNKINENDKNAEGKEGK